MNSRFTILKISYLVALLVLIGTTVKAQMTVSVAPTSPTCNTYTNGWATANVTGGIAPYAYSWSNGQPGGQTVLGIRAGDYTVTVTDAVGTQKIQNFTVTQPSALVPTALPVGGVCLAGLMTYQASASGSTSPYSYEWRNLGTNQVFKSALLNAPASGSYHLSVTDAQGCQVTKVVNIMGDIDITIVTTPAICNGVPNGSAEARVTGGLPPYNYRWSFNEATTPLINVSGGTYRVTVIDANGCQKIAQGEVSEPPPLEINLLVTGRCSDAAIAKVTPSGGTPPFTMKWSNGGIGNQQSNLSTGIHFVTVTDAAGCTKVGQINVSNQAGVKVSTNKTDAACLGVNTGTASASVPGTGLGAYSFTWSNGTTTTGTTSAISNLAPGTYFVTAIDGAGCRDSSTVTVNPGRTVTFTTTPTDAACGNSNGAAAVTNPTGGTAPYTYKWSNNATTASISGLAPDNYVVTVTDATGCYGIGTVTVRGASNINFSVAKTSSICGAATGTITISNITGGIAPYTYKWSDLTGGNQSATRTDLTVGTYTVSVTDAVNCTKISTITVTGKANFNLTGNSANATCGNNDGTASVVPTLGGTAPFTYLWSTGATTPSVSNLAAGTYTVTVTDATGCIGTTTVTVFATGNFTIGISTTNTVCGAATGTASVTNVTGGIPPYSYRWNNGGTTQTISNLPPGDYIAIVTDATGCQATSRTMVVGSTSAVSIAPPLITSATCTQPNGKIIVSGTNGTAPYTYKLGTTSNTTGIFDNLIPGKYVVTVTDASSCAFKTDTLKIEDKGAVKAQFGINPLTCFGDSLLVNFSNNSLNGVTYTWLFSDNRTSTQTSPTLYFNAIQGFVRLIARSPEGCVDSLTQGFPASPLKFTLVDSLATCTNNSVSASVLNTGNAAIKLSYQWTPSASVVGSDTSATATLRVPAAGSSYVYVLVKNALGCSKLDSVKVQAVEKPANLLNSVTYTQNCETKAITFTITGPVAAYYTWLLRNPTVSKDSLSFTSIFTRVGPDTLLLVPKLGCLDTVRLPFNVRDGSAVNVSLIDNDTTVCNSGKLTLRAASNINAFEWSTNKNFTSILGTGANLLITPTDPRNVYYVRSRNAAGCLAIDSVVITNAEIKIGRATQVDACANINKTITVTNLTSTPITVVWSPSSSLVSDPTTLSPIVKITADGNLVGSFRNAAGCTLRDTIPLKVHSVDASVMASAKVIYVDDIVTLISTPSNSTFKYSWTPPATVNSPTSMTTTASPKEPTTYIVKITDPFGCEDTASVFVDVLTPLCATPYVFVPRAFTPNGDGNNEKVFVRGDYLIEMEFVIYNRWGEQVFLTKDRTEGWDGTFRGAMVCPDVYGYYVKGKCKKGEDFFVKGNITVLK